MRTWHSSIRVLIGALALYLATVLVLGMLALAMRAAAAPAPPAPPPVPVAPVAPIAPAASVPILVKTSGTVVARGGGLLGVRELGGDQPVAFMVGDRTAIMRDGAGATLADLREGDHVLLLVDGRTGQALEVRAEPGSAPATRGRDALGLLAALALSAAAAVLFARRRVAAWPTVGRAAARRPLVAGWSRGLGLPGRSGMVGARRWGGPQHA